MVKSEPENYYKEKIGVKNNTIRILSKKDFKKLDVTQIKIRLITENQQEQEQFIRDIKDISVIGEIVGYYLICITWKHKKGVGEIE